MKQTFFLILFFSAFIVAQEAQKPWEKLGLSQTEWQMIKDANLSMGKVEDLLKTGIGIGEYLSSPWEKYGLTESQWIKKRRSGMTNYDIQLDANIKNDSSFITGTKNDIKSDFSSMSGNGQAISSLFLPGYQQIKAGKKGKGAIMISLAGGSLIWCAGDGAINHRFNALPICLLAADMIWSFIDYQVTNKN